MEIDHIFIFSSNNGKFADLLVENGFTEGSNRIHKGQGTANRKFYFENFFLEILWVHDETEISTSIFREIGLWQRSEFKTNGYSPFGLCLVNTTKTDNHFANSILYQPDYFPVGMPIEITQNEEVTSLPWTFRLPFKGVIANSSEPKNHKNGVKSLTKAQFEFIGIENDFSLNFNESESIRFLPSIRNWLTLQFDDCYQNITIDFEELNLTIHY